MKNKKKWWQIGIVVIFVCVMYKVIISAPSQGKSEVYKSNWEYLRDLYCVAGNVEAEELTPETVEQCEEFAKQITLGNMTRAEVYELISENEMYVDFFSELSTEDFIVDMYKVTFKAEPDDEIKNYYLGLIESGNTRKDVVNAMCEELKDKEVEEACGIK